MMYTSGKRCFKFTQSYFDAELCNILLCYIKTPVRDLNFVGLTIIQRLHQLKISPKSLVVWGTMPRL